MDIHQWLYVAFWIIAIGMIWTGAKHLFASDETLLRNADRFFTDNPLIARVVCVVFLILGLGLAGFMLTVSFPFF